MELLRTYHAWMFEIQKAIGSDDLLHLNVGLAIWVLTAVLRGGRFSARANLLPLVVLEGANEIIDFIDGAGWSLADTIGDVLWSLLWPFVITFVIRMLGRRRRDRQIRAEGRVAAASIEPDRRTAAVPLFSHDPRSRVRNRTIASGILHLLRSRIVRTGDAVLDRSMRSKRDR